MGGVSAADHVAREGALLLSGVEDAGFDAAVPSCPGWDASTLLLHVARVHRWAAGNLRAARTGGEHTRLGSIAPGEDDDLVQWYSHGLAGLVEEMHIADPSRPAWTHVPGQETVAFWLTRQASETLVHRIDAELAADASTPVDPALAAEATVELLDVLAGPLLNASAGVAPAVVEIAGIGRWTFEGTTLTRSEEPPTVVVSGSAEQTLRAIYGRAPWADVPAAGDVAWLDDLQTVLRP